MRCNGPKCAKVRGPIASGAVTGTFNGFGIIGSRFWTYPPAEF